MTGPFLETPPRPWAELLPDSCCLFQLSCIPSPFLVSCELLKPGRAGFCRILRCSPHHKQVLLPGAPPPQLATVSRFHFGVNPMLFPKPAASWHVMDMEGESLGLETGRLTFERQFCHLHSLGSHHTALSLSVHTNIKSDNNTSCTEFCEESDEMMHVKTAHRLFRGMHI